MEYHSYDTLFNVIKNQYPKSRGIWGTSTGNKEDAIIGSLVNAYQVPTTDNLLKALKTVTISEKKPIEKDDINSYIYIHK